MKKRVCILQYREFLLSCGVLLLSILELNAASMINFPLNEVKEGKVKSSDGIFFGSVHGKLEQASGAVDKALLFDGNSSFVTVSPVSEFSIDKGPFSISVWVNPYSVGSGQQMIVGKNVYCQNQREWSLLLDNDGLFRFYAYDNGWKKVAAKTSPKAGNWCHVAVTFEDGITKIFVNGKLEGNITLPAEIDSTEAPLSVGGIKNGQSLMQLFNGALDEVCLYREVLSSDVISKLAARHPVPHKVAIIEPIKLWDGPPIPKTADMPMLKDVSFSVIKPYEFLKDGYRFLHGVALGWHKGRLYASIGHNQGGENTDTEEARVCYSDDNGKSWSKLVTIDGRREPGVGVSHGVFLSEKGRFWAFHGAYEGTMKNVHTRAYLLNEKDGTWERKGTIIGGGFWPMQEPIKMDDGNWIMGGLRAGDGNPAAVAISHGDNFMKWDLVVIPKARATGNMWGESTVIVEGKKITNISRYGKEAKALAAFSEDYGRTWSKMRVSNLPMATSKPYTGLLSTGQRYLICSSTADGGGRRSPLTIALSRPGEETFSKVYVIRHAVFPEGPGESHKGAKLSYPYAVEHDGKLYVGYSNSGGGVGRVGEGRQLWNNNSAELAVIPLSSL